MSSTLAVVLNTLGILVLIVMIFLVGWFSALYRIAKDPGIVTLQLDEAITKKPQEGYVLAQVTPEILRQLMKGDVEKEGSEYEARNLIKRRSQT